MTNEHEDLVDLARWAEDFRGDAPPTLSPAAVLEQARRDARRERILWAEQSVGTLFAVAIFLTLVVRTRSPLLTGLSAVVVPTLVFLSGYFVYVRGAVARSLARSVREHAALAVRRRRADVRIARASLVAQVFLAIVFWAWFPVFALSNAERFGREPWRLVIGAGTSLVIFGVSLVFLVRRARRARAELEQASRTLSALDSDADRAP
jgi:uncharacterized membrane protein YvlD (DUF360 family)